MHRLKIAGASDDRVQTLADLGRDRQTSCTGGFSTPRAAVALAASVEE
jgi:hypothetical protein